MGKNSRKITRVVKGLAGLDYVEIKHVPMDVDPELGNLIDADVVARMEHMVAQELILRRLPLRGREVKFLRSIFAMSQREFADKLGLSHVAICKWEKAVDRRLDIIQEIAVKVLVVDQLGLSVAASLYGLIGKDELPKKLVLDFSEAGPKRKSA